MASLDNSYNTGIVPPHLRTTTGISNPYQGTSGLPPTTVPTVGSGISNPYPSGGGLPPSPVGSPPAQNPGPATPIAGVPLSKPTPNAGNFGPVQTVQQALDGFINGKYAQDARLRGLEHANQRGMLNGSIAAGASQRAALDRVQPLVDQTMNFLNNREDRALRQQLQNDAVLQQNWLQTQQFNNQFNATLKMLPVTNSLQMLQALTQYAMNEPEVFTPQVMNGYTNFFNNNMLQLLKQYFPGAK